MTHYWLSGRRGRRLSKLMNGFAIDGERRRLDGDQVQVTRQRGATGPRVNPYRRLGNLTRPTWMRLDQPRCRESCCLTGHSVVRVLTVPIHGPGNGWTHAYRVAGRA